MNVTIARHIYLNFNIAIFPMVRYNTFEEMMNMDKFVPFEKLSKRNQRELNRRRRQVWGEVNPVTRVTKNMKAYDRAKARRLNDDDYSGVGLFELNCVKHLS